MRIQKVLNNNVVMSFDDNEKECIVIGNGIGFQKKPNDIVNDFCIEKIFRLDDECENELISNSFSDTSDQLFNVVVDIVQQAMNTLGKKIHKSIYASLLDHLDFALERCRNNISVKCMLIWDIKRLYKDEFNIGLSAIQNIKEKFRIELPEDEAAFIALHLLSSQTENELLDINNTTKVIQDILNVVKHHLKNECDEESVNFQRFVTHLKFFAHRVLAGTYMVSKDKTLHDIFARKYITSYECAKKIDKCITHQYGRSLSEDEIMFLAMHIERVSN